MLRFLTATAAALVLAGLSSAGSAESFPTDPRTADDSAFLEIIVKACHPAETALQPINQGISYDNAKAPTREERIAMYRKLGCIDVPIPMQYITGTMTATACRGHAGYLAAMQFIEQRPDLAEYSAVGGWDCILSDHPVISPIGQ